MRSILCVMKKVVDIDPAPRSPFHNFSGDSMSTGGGPLWVGSAQHEGTKTRLRHDLDGRVGDLANGRIRKEIGSITLSTPHAKLRCQMRGRSRRVESETSDNKGLDAHPQAVRVSRFCPVQGGAKERRNGGGQIESTVMGGSRWPKTQ